LEPTQPLIQWVPRDLSLEVKLPGHEAEQSPPSRAEVKKCVEIHLHSPYTLMASCSVKIQGQFHLFTFHILT